MDALSPSAQPPGIRSRLLREPVLVALGSLAFALLFAWPLLGHLGQFGAFHDWEFSTELHFVPYFTVWHYHQLPLWNPYKCGGMPMLGNPQSRILTPFFLLHLLTGPVVGLHLEVILHLALAWAGGYVLARTIGISRIGAIVCASVFPSNAWFSLHLGEGHAVFLPAAYLPWIAALYILASNRRRLFPASVAGLLLALCLWEGGLYVAIFGVVLIASLTAPMVIVRKSLWPLWSAVCVAAFGAGFIMIKLLPALEVFRAHPREPMGGEGNPWSLLISLLTSRNQDILGPGPGFGFQEYGAYISLAFLVLAALGVFGGWRKSFPWIVSGAVFILMARGDSGSHSIWVLLRSIRVFAVLISAMRLPSRFLGPMILSLAVLAGLGADLLGRIARPWGARLSLAVLLVGLIDALLVGPPNLKYIFRDSTPRLPQSWEFRQMRQLGAKFNMTHVAEANMGALECYEYTDIDTKVVGYDQEGYRGEQFLIGPGKVQIERWTPNDLTYSVSSLAPTVLAINQNYDPGWVLTKVIGLVLSRDGLLGVAVPAGNQTIRLTYRSKPFDYGLILAVLAAVAMLLLWRYENAEHTDSTKVGQAG